MNSPSEASGFHVPGYQILESIGQGAMGTVYEALSQDGQLVALKVLLPFEEGNEMALERFRREINISVRIGHPGVPRVFEAGQLSDGRFFYAMERLHGADLEVWRLGPKRTRLEAVSIIAAALEPLAAAHDVAIVHRDLKPENIFVEDSGAVRLLDFGVARHMNVDSKLRTSTGIAVGTPVYMSPEQATAPSAVGPASDVWSVGVMLYEALTGTLPFDGESLHGVILAACTKEPEPIHALAPDVDPRLSSLVHRCLEKAPADRPRNARQLADELNQLLTTGSVRDSLVASAQLQPRDPQPTSGEITIPPAPMPATVFADATARPAVPATRSAQPLKWIAAAAALLLGVGGGVWAAGEQGSDTAPETSAGGEVASEVGPASPLPLAEPEPTTAAMLETPEMSDEDEPEPELAVQVEPEPELAVQVEPVRRRPRPGQVDRPGALAARTPEPTRAAAEPNVETARPNPEPNPQPTVMEAAPSMSPAPDPVPRVVEVATPTTTTTMTTTMTATMTTTRPRETPPARPDFVTF